MIELRKARRLAAALVDELAPACERLEVAGSIRRRAPVVTDVELLAIPRWEDRAAGGQLGLFSTTRERVNLLHELIAQIGPARIRPIKPGSAAPADGRSWPADDLWPAKRTGDRRYFRLWLPLPEVKVDLFMPTAETWGVIQTIRTGSADFSAALVQHWTRASGGGRIHRGRIHLPFNRVGRPVAYKDGIPLGAAIAAPTEEDVFRVLGLRWVDPVDRRGAESLVAEGPPQILHPSTGAAPEQHRSGTRLAPDMHPSTGPAPELHRSGTRLAPDMHPSTGPAPELHRSAP